MIYFCTYFKSEFIFFMKNLFIRNPFERLQKGAVVILCIVLAGTVSSCSSKSESDIDMSDIDFSNIENLYEQPLPVIQKCVQGKWKWYVSVGGESGISYHDNIFVDINSKYYVIEYGDGQQNTIFFEWQRREIFFPFFEDPLYKGKESYLMWNKNANGESLANGWFFESIKNDTLFVLVDTYPRHIYDFPYRLGFVRINEK